MRYSLRRFVLGALLLLPILVGGAVYAEEITSVEQCNSVIKDTEEAIHDNPTVGEKATKVLLSVMELAKKRCEEQQFSNANDLLELARGMVASE